MTNASAQSKQQRQTKNDTKNTMMKAAASAASTATTKPRILCLHGKFQSGAILSNKIAGARRKLERVYELDFLDAPIVLPTPILEPAADDQQQQDQPPQPQPKQLAWWVRNDDNENIDVDKAFDYVLDYINKGNKRYDALLGFSQGGTLVTSLVLSGKIPSTIQAVVTAGSPFVSEAYEIAIELAAASGDDSNSKFGYNLDMPKLHFAGETDDMVPVESTKRLCETSGNGELRVHEKGHLFPTKAVYTNYMMKFLSKHVSVPSSGEPSLSPS